MSTATTLLSDSLPSSIPKLNNTGLNWAIFSVRFQDVIEAKGFWGHFDGTTLHLVAVAILVTRADGTTTTVNDATAIDQWDKNK
ncbi:hypothetical protein BYT27DRAFT_7279520 [Phlegmacium glaucopus]|nr:hypothetical protein BYT27DRAFT_7318089 [Phlegmacium glaucopus]KAF8810879.1 hypothetical protein BYT27DRAFT_7279520 [Phlegmacium glaucopus]